LQELFDSSLFCSGFEVVDVSYDIQFGD